MKRTPQERHLAREKRRANKALALAYVAEAKQERERAEQLLLTANQRLNEAEDLYAASLLLRSGWTLTTSGLNGHRRRWYHPSGYVISRILLGPRWFCGKPDEATLCTCDDSIEVVLEWWFLQTTHLGRYPEAPSKGLFDKLRGYTSSKRCNAQLCE